MLGIAAFVAMIVLIIQIYRTAKDSGRNAIAWLLIAIGVGVGLQLVLPIIIGMIIGTVMIAQGTSPDGIQDAIALPATILGFVTIGLSFLGLWLIHRQVSKPLPMAASSVLPPPPTFQ